MKASLQMLLLAAVAALALVAHKGPTTVALRKPVTPPKPVMLAVQEAPVQKPPGIPPGLYVGDDFSADAPIVGKLGLGRSQEPVMFVRPKTPVFTDIGQKEADSSVTHFGASDTNLEAQAVQKEITTEVPLAGTIFQVADILLGGGNAAGLSPQQMAYACPGGKCQPNALALAEGRMGTKTILINGEYVTIGGAALGGPGLTDAVAAVAEERLSARAAPSKLLG